MDLFDFPFEKKVEIFIKNGFTYRYVLSHIKKKLHTDESNQYLWSLVILIE